MNLTLHKEVFGPFDRAQDALREMAYFLEDNRDNTDYESSAVRYDGHENVYWATLYFSQWEVKN